LLDAHAPCLEGIALEEPRYRLKVSIPVPDDEAVVRATDAPEAQGFGVLTIDVKATLKGKLDRDFRKYLILGACNPPLADRAITGGDVLERFAHEHDGLVVGRRLVHVRVHKAFGMKLAEHEQLPRRIVADHAHVMVDLAVLVLLLRRPRKAITSRMAIRWTTCAS